LSIGIHLVSLNIVVSLNAVVSLNIHGKGAAIESDFFYLFVVQLLFGITNGDLGSNCVMDFTEQVDQDELEAAAGFMSLCLVGGLVAGSFLGFFAAPSP
jgi:equilibrative nucleoside transporter 1/2/3